VWISCRPLGAIEVGMTCVPGPFLVAATLGAAAFVPGEPLQKWSPARDLS